MGTPRSGLAPTPPLATSVGRGEGRLCVGDTGKPLRCPGLDVRGDTRGFLGLGGGICRRGLVGHLPGVDAQQADGGQSQAPRRILHGHAADDTLPMPVARRLLPGPPRFCEPEGEGPVLLAPRRHLLAHRTRARPQREPPHALLQTQPQRAFTLSRTVGHQAVHAGECEGHTCLNRPRGLGAVTGRPIAPAQAPREAITADAATQEHLLEISRPSLAGPIGRPRRDRPCDRAGFRLLGAVQGDRRRLLMEPGGRAGRDLQSVEGDRPKHAVAMGGKERVEALPEPVILARGALEAGLKQGEPPTFLQTCPHCRAGMMTIENRQD